MNLGERITTCRKARNLSQMELALACGWDNQGRVNNYEKGRREPTLKDIETIAKSLWASPEWLAYGLGSPPDYLAYSVIPEGKGLVIGMAEVKDWHDSLFNPKELIKKRPRILQPFRAGHSSAGDSLNQLELITVPNKNRNQYGVRLDGNSMTSPASGTRSFRQGEVIVVDPVLAESNVSHSSFVLVLQKDSPEVLFKQYILDGKKWFLHPLNPQYEVIPFDSKTMTICSVLIESRDVLIKLNQ